MVLIEVFTDTATICVYDLTCLRHRKDDVGDWWSIPEDRFVEMRTGNVLFFDVGDDGGYAIDVVDDPIDGVRRILKVPSGRVFIGPGEETSGGGFEPDGSWGGDFISLDPGFYICTVARSEDRILLNFQRTHEGTNIVEDSIRI
ncbi:MAG: DUF6386 family protein [Sphingopyxis sp.]|uniref:DUF6386 family protein n=1 Tax=Sphingopyxis sp. TaxID=1908224 RepID=UPI003D6CB51E